MAKNIDHISHLKSNSLNNGMPSPPSSGSIVYGEIAINYKSGAETIFTRNDTDKVVAFSSDQRYSEMKLGSGFTGSNSGRTVTQAFSEDEEVIASALNDLNDRIAEVASNADNDYVSQGVYDSNAKRIYLKNKSGDTLVSIDATAFIKDGMVNNVELSGTSLVITFNTDSGLEPITIDLTQLFDASAYYTKDEIDEKMGSALTGDNSGLTVTDFVENLLDDIYSIIGSGISGDNLTQVIIDDEYAISLALNDLNQRISDISSDVTYHLDDIYGYLDERLGSDFTGENSGRTVTEAIGEINDIVGSGISGYNLTEVIVGNELTTARAIIDLDTRINGMSSEVSGIAQEVDDIDYTTSVALNGLNQAISSLTNDLSYFETQVAEIVGDGFSGQTITEAITEIEYVASNALNSLNERVDGIHYYIENKLGTGFTGSNSTVTVTQYISEQIGNVNEVIGTGFLPSSSMTDVVTALEDKVLAITDSVSGINAELGEKIDVNALEEKLGTAFSGENSGRTVTEVIIEDELACAAALNNLDERVVAIENCIGGLPITSASGTTIEIGPDVVTMASEITSALTITLGTNDLNPLRSSVYEVLVPVASSYTSPSITVTPPVGYNLIGGSVSAAAGHTSEITILCVGTNMYIKSVQY